MRVVESKTMKPGGICACPLPRREPPPNDYARNTATFFKYTEPFNKRGSFSAITLGQDPLSLYQGSLTTIKASSTKPGVWEFFKEDGTTR